MKYYIVVFFIVLFLFPSAGFASPVLTVKTDAAEFCQPLFKMLFTVTGRYVNPPDPEQEKQLNEAGAPLPVLGVTAGFLNVHWEHLGWGDFSKREPDLYNSFGLGRYDVGYTVYLGQAAFYGDSHLHDVYRVIKLRSNFIPDGMTPQPELLVSPEDTGLDPAFAKYFSDLHAIDAFWYGPKTYLVVRKPGDIIIYQFNPDAHVADWQKQPVNTTIACEYDMEEPPPPPPPPPPGTP